MAGFLLIDKPKGITSHDVVDKIRRVTSEKRVGHAGTLDPNATGLLIIGVGREATKKLGFLSKNVSKVYEAHVVLGEARDTDDVEGKVVSSGLSLRPDRNAILKTLESFKGEQMQTPPAFSAIKLKGKKAYELARKGKKVKLEPRKIKIFSINVKKYAYPDLLFNCKVSSGTYIRALARDIGKELKTGAYLKDLRRLKIGDYDIKDAIKLEDVASSWSEQSERYVKHAPLA